ncbi:hypothetical protein TNCV_1372931 [Trichonephila clavipes]|uniref:Uncharacterized protein n=1 Tax=Trichonephila clavipes TaxID=2585209 RepID=A0A8X6WHG4_TRICX|nr:hypothetical protein TNCV_1372931 [Trichonephila clavipes]
MTAVRLVLGSNPEEDMDVCNRAVPSWHEGTLNSRRAANPRWLLSHNTDGDGPRNFEQVSSDEDDIRVCNPCQTTTREFQFGQIECASVPLHGGFSVEQGLELMTSVRDHNP